MKLKHRHFWKPMDVTGTDTHILRSFVCSCGKGKMTKSKLKTIIQPKGKAHKPVFFSLGVGKQASKSRKRISTPPKPKKTRKRLNPVSESQKGKNARYAVLRREFLEKNPVCQCVVPEMGKLLENCLEPATEIHHRARRGKNFLDTKYFMAVCHTCHQHIEQNPLWAKEHSYIIPYHLS